MNTGFRASGLAWSHAAWSGNGKITEKVKDGATGEGLQRRVRLDERETGRLVRTTFSAEDGTYVFDHMKLGVEFMVYAIDYTGTYDAVIADRVTAIARD